MPGRISTILLKTIIIAIALTITAVVGCGKRGPLYLPDAESEQTQPGHELTQEADDADQKKKPAVKKD